MRGSPHLILELHLPAALLHHLRLDVEHDSRSRYDERQRQRASHKVLYERLQFDTVTPFVSYMMSSRLLLLCS